MSMSTSFWRIFHRVPQNVLQASVMISMIAMLLQPIGFPLTIGPTTVRGYEAVDALAPGSVLLLSMSFGSGTMPQFVSAASAHTHHAIDNGLKAVYVSNDPEGPGMFRQVDKYVNFEARGWVYGEDYVFLGFIAGEETMFASLMDDIRSATPVDYYGTNLDAIPLMQNVNSNEDFALVATYTGSSENVESWVRQAATRYNLPLICSVVGSMFPPAMPFYGSGQITGLQNDAVGSAEYEALSGHLGLATSLMDVLSLSETVVLFWMIVANIGTIGLYLTRKR